MNPDPLHVAVHAAHHLVARIEALVDQLAIPLQEAHLARTLRAARHGQRPSLDASYLATAASVGLGPFWAERLAVWMAGVPRPASLDEVRALLLGAGRVSTVYVAASPLSWRQRAIAALGAVHALLDHTIALASTPDEASRGLAIVDELCTRGSAPCPRLGGSAFRAWCLEQPIEPSAPLAQCG